MTAALYQPPNYPLRRAVALAVVLVVLVLAALAAIAMVEAVADLGGRPAAASETATDLATDAAAAIVRIHVAEAGDTLWSIADEHRGEVGRDGYIDALIDLNGGTSIQIGQGVRLP